MKIVIFIEKSDFGIFLEKKQLREDKESREPRYRIRGNKFLIVIGHDHYRVYPNTTKIPEV